LGHSLWIFGFFQIFSNVGYILVAGSDVNRLLMYGATGFEQFAGGMGTGAFSVLLLRMTQKRFSATQYALFSSLFGLPRIVAGPISGFAVDAVGWAPFFWSTLACGIPGLVLLSRFVPIGVREPSFVVEPPKRREPLTVGQLTLRGMVGGILGTAFGALLVATVGALKTMRVEAERGFEFGRAFLELLSPDGVAGWLQLVGLVAFGLVCGLFTAAVIAARRGAGEGLATGDETPSSNAD
jgi:PAT family beta-lactamase induction signal transducer AmpG